MKKRAFRANLTISYEKHVDPINFRHPIHFLMANLAWLYSLDYWFEIDKKDWLTETDPDSCCDLLYFRATKDTEIDGKSFRSIVTELFDRSFLCFLTADVGFQLQKHLKHFPFPSEFYRPLNYPCVEYHKDGQASLQLHAAWLDTISQKDIDS